MIVSPGGRDGFSGIFLAIGGDGDAWSIWSS